MFAFLHTKYLLKKSQLWKKSKFFPFRVDPFSEDRQANYDSAAAHESATIPLIFFPNHLTLVLQGRVQDYLIGAREGVAPRNHSL